MTTQTRHVWDISIRVFHWSLVVVFTIAYLSGDDGERLHAYAGYAVLGLVTYRFIWGVIGTKYARFRDFCYPPHRVKKYLVSLMSSAPEHYIGHSPAGGWMVFALLFSLLCTTLTGVQVYGLEGYGPLAHYPNNAIITIPTENNFIMVSDQGDNHNSEDNFWEELWEEVHEFFANLTVGLIVIHIAGVLLVSMRHRENLVRSMITGTKAIKKPNNTEN